MHSWLSLPVSTCWMVRSNFSSRSRRESTQGAVAILRRKKGPRLCISKLRSNEFYSTESWRNGIERFGGTQLKFSGCTWYEIEKKLGKEEGNLEALSEKVNLMSEILAHPILRNKHLRKPHNKQIVPAKQHGIWREKYLSSKPRTKLRFILLWK